jgi:flagellar hook-associated protein 2
MAGITIPGVSDKYKTSALVESLMEVERIPLKREQATLETYQSHAAALRGVNGNLSALRESTRSLYSYDNPFSNKIASSTNENAVTASPGRAAAFGSFKIDVMQTASADRFMSGDLEKTADVPAGTYTYSVADKTVTLNWKGGKLSDFVSALNKRGAGAINASLIGVSGTKQSLSIESLKTGAENRLVFKDAAFDWAMKTNMIRPAETETARLGVLKSELNDDPAATGPGYSPVTGLPNLTRNAVTAGEGQDGSPRITVPPRGAFSLSLTDSVLKGAGALNFTLSTAQTDDITVALNRRLVSPDLPHPGSAEFEGIVVDNAQSETTLAKPVLPETGTVPRVDNDLFVFVRNKDGSEIPVDTASIEADENGVKKVSLKLSDYPGIESLVARNENTGKTLVLSPVSVIGEDAALGYEPVNPASRAGDAKIKYEGITITRPSNEIDDVVPDVTIALREPTAKTETVSIRPDTESAKNALITFVGRYNRATAEINILTQGKQEIIDELEYLTDDERTAARERLGMFMGDTTLTQAKTAFQAILANRYAPPASDDSQNAVSLLTQIGISTKSVSSSGYSAASLRGYLEIDEKKLDEALAANLTEIKNLFGYDSDGDLIIDSGIAYQLDQRLLAYTRSDGIIAAKTSGLDTSIASTEKRIKRLEEQLDNKERQLKAQYAQMESTLNSLEGQSAAVSNFARQGQKE